MVPAEATGLAIVDRYHIKGNMITHHISAQKRVVISPTIDGSRARFNARKGPFRHFLLLDRGSVTSRDLATCRVGILASSQAKHKDKGIT